MSCVVTSLPSMIFVFIELGRLGDGVLLVGLSCCIAPGTASTLVAWPGSRYRATVERVDTIYTYSWHGLGADLYDCRQEVGSALVGRAPHRARVPRPARRYNFT